MSQIPWAGTRLPRPDEIVVIDSSTQPMVFETALLLGIPMTEDLKRYELT